MFCGKCGNQILNGAKFCSKCGAPTLNNQEILQQTNPIIQQPINQNFDFSNNMNQQQNTRPMYEANYSQIQTKNPINNIFVILAWVFVGAFLLFVGIGIFFNNKEVDNNQGNVVSNTKVNHSDFTFSIPNNYKYDSTAEGLAIYDSSDSWVAIITAGEGSFDILLSKKDQIKDIYEENGYTVYNVSEKTYDGKPYITIELSFGGEKSVLAFTKGSPNYALMVAVISKSNTFDYSILENVSPILKTAIYAGNGGMNISTGSIPKNLVGNLAK